MKKIYSYCAGLYSLFLLKRQRRFYHRSVETLSIGAWWKVRETSDFKWLIDSRSFWSRVYLFFHKTRSDKTIKSSIVFEEINDTYIKYVKLAKEQKRLVELKQKRHLLQCDLIIKEDRFINNLIKIKNAEIAMVEKDIKDKSENGRSNSEMIEELEDDRPITIDIWNTTVLKFYNRFKHYKEKREREIEQMENAA